jgi:N-acetylglutamate synthase-like GNAT family acetyltransferase
MEIIENKIELLDDFVRLNEEWISTYFELEAADKKLAANPYKIIENGGYIFSLVSNNEVLGVCALFNDGHGTFELARMAVAPQYLGNGYG